ncbi:coiled-coil domain-containing protein 1 [Diachasma alloeum]|uniref:coiled-coil domain-containing protein 1 n=1 Tax=Diachasma alloeum TaxID=454923 RepID=UPI0007381316|nr:coiled-coil domain-containing protein 1 [Diachasma alloeum]
MNDIIDVLNNEQGSDGDDDAAHDIDDSLILMNAEAGVNADEDPGADIVNDPFLILLNDELDYDVDEDAGDDIDIDNSVISINAGPGINGDEDTENDISNALFLFTSMKDELDCDKDEDAEGVIDIDDSVFLINDESDVNGPEDARDYGDDDDDDVHILPNDPLDYEGDEAGEAEVDDDDIINALNDKRCSDKHEVTADYGDNNEPVEKSVNGDEETNHDMSSNNNGHQTEPSINLINTNPWNRGGGYRVEILANADVFID